MIALLALLACGPTVVASVAEPPPIAATAPSAPSLYDLRASLVDEAGATVGFDVDRGHPVLVTLIYTACPSACPLTIERVKHLVDGRPDARVLLVSMDPDDTPAALSADADGHHLDSRFRLVRGDEPDLRRIAHLLGFRYEKLGPHEYAHSSTVVLLDANGGVAARSEGDSEDGAITAALSAMGPVDGRMPGGVARD